MKEKIVAKRYAEALMAYAAETLGAGRIIDEFAALKVISGANPEFGEFLKAPEVTAAEKNGFIDRVLQGNFSAEMRQFLKLLVEKKRTPLLGEIADYIRINYSHGEAREAILKMAYPQDEGTIRAIKDRLESRLGEKLSFFLEIDGGLLGGAEAVIGSKVIDGSVRRRLDDLRERLRTVRVA